jgi:hypothetical protein
VGGEWRGGGGKRYKERVAFRCSRYFSPKLLKPRTHPSFVLILFPSPRRVMNINIIARVAQYIQAEKQEAAVNNAPARTYTRIVRDSRGGALLPHHSTKRASRGWRGGDSAIYLRGARQGFLRAIKI